jgi:hypothetical protein
VGVSTSRPLPLCAIATDEIPGILLALRICQGERKPEFRK